MKILIAEDDFMVRRILKEILSPYGDCDIVIDGNEAVQAFRMAWEDNKPYDLICLDIMMPVMDGQEALKIIRKEETEMAVHPSEEVKVIMITALDDQKSIFEAYYKGGATSYIVKPVDKEKLLEEIQKLGLIDEQV